MSFRGWALPALAVFGLLFLLYPLYGFPKVEDDLTAAAEDVPSFRAVDGAEIVFNGRDGYLTVPVGLDQVTAERMAADLGDIRGVRDVEIVVDATAVTEATEPSEFEIAWIGDERTASGVTSATGVAAIDALAGDDGVTGDEAVSLSPDVADLLDRLVPEASDRLSEGTVTVSGDEVRVTGVAASADDADALTGAFAGVNDLSFNITTAGAEPADDDEFADTEPANFTVRWDDKGTKQSGVAPVNTRDALTALGVESPAVDAVAVSDEVLSGLEALAGFIPDGIAGGTATVTDGDTLVITGTAPTEDALDRATTAFADNPDVDLQLDLSTAADAQGAIEQLLALNKIEFISGTAMPTDETLDLIEQIAIVLAANPDVALDIVGHTDSLGNATANQSLSEWRAHAVFNGLVGEGIEPERLTAEGRGETEPIDTNDTADGRQRNRRVELSAKEIG